MTVDPLSDPTPDRPVDAAPAWPTADATATPGSPFRLVRVREWALWLAVVAIAATALVVALARLRRDFVPALFLPLVLVTFHGTSALWMRAALARLGLSWRRLVGRWPTPAELVETVALTAAQFTFALMGVTVVIGLQARFAPRLAARWLESSNGAFAPEVSPPALTWIGLVLVAPAIEELLFRGVLLHRFAATLGPRRALLASAVLFALPHADNVLGAFAFALVLGALYLRTGSLWPCLLAHALNNAVPALLITLPQRHPAAPMRVAEMGARLPQALAGAAVAAMVLGAWLALRWPARDAPMPYDRAATPES